MHPIVTLTTDFGYGVYLAQLKAVLLGYRRDLQIVDITHDIPPQNIGMAAIALADATPRFPPETLHLAVVDPGVGTNRKLVYVEAGAWRYILPDNGLIGIVAAQWPVQRVVELTRPQFWAPIVSPTFHGRDIMAHVTGHLLQGRDPLELGQIKDSLFELPVDRPNCSEGRLFGKIGFIDHFGNLISNISRTDFGQFCDMHQLAQDQTQVRLPGVDELPAWSQTYGTHPTGTLVAVFDSQDRLEIAMVGGNAARSHGQSVGGPVEVVIASDFC